MPEIEISPDLIQIDAEVVAKALKLTPQDLRQHMRDGTVTSRFETGEGADAGRVRLTFQSATRRARFTADMTGAILSCTTLDFGHRPATEAPPARDPAAPPVPKTRPDGTQS